MENNRAADGTLTPLANKNIDTGMGLERMAQILQRVPNNYETDIIMPIVQRAAEVRLPASAAPPPCAYVMRLISTHPQLANLDYASADEAVKTRLKVVGDHTRAVTYLISDGVLPSNVGRGYIVRRLIRRVVRNGRLLGIPGDVAFTPKVAQVAVQLSAGCDPAVAKNAGTFPPCRKYHDIDALPDVPACDSENICRAGARGTAVR